MLKTHACWNRIPTFIASLSVLVWSATATAITIDESRSHALVCVDLVFAGCVGDEGLEYAFVERYGVVYEDPYGYATAGRLSGVSAYASSYTDEMLPGGGPVVNADGMTATATRTAVYNVSSPQPDGTPVSLRIHMTLEGSLFSDGPNGGGLVEYEVSIKRDGASYPSELTTFLGSAAWGYGNPLNVSRDFTIGDLDLMNPKFGESFYQVDLQRSYDFEANVGDGSFSVTYQLIAQSFGIGTASFGNTGTIALEVLTQDSEVVAVPGPSAGLAHGSALLCTLLLYRRRVARLDSLVSRSQ